MPRKQIRRLRGSGAGHLHPTLKPVIEKLVGDSHSQESPENSENSAERRVRKPDPLLSYDWHGEFLILCERFADRRVAAYVAWASSPVVGRTPKMLLDLARLLGLRTDRTIRLWREKDQRIDETITELQAAPLRQFRRDLYNALMVSALIEGTGGHADRKLALEMLGDYVQKSKHEVANKAPAYTSDELAEAAKQLALWEAETNSNGLNG